MDTNKPWIDAFSPPIPSEYSDAMSYEQELRACHRKMVELINSFNDVTDTLTKYLDGRIAVIDADLQDKITMLRQDLSTEIERVSDNLFELVDLNNYNTNQRISSLNRQVTAINENLNRRVDAAEDSQRVLYSRLAADIKDVMDAVNAMQDKLSQLGSEQLEFKVHVNSMFANLKAELTDMIAKQISRSNADNLLVTNPVNQSIDILRHVLADIMDVKTPYPVLAEQFNGMRITADDFNAMHIPAYLLDAWGGMVFFERLHLTDVMQRLEGAEDEINAIKEQKVISYISGNLLTPYEYSNEIAEALITTKYSPITADDFNEKDISQDDFNGWDISSTQFNLYGIDTTPNV